MVTNLKNITFHFENCDYITIDGKYIGGFLVEDIRTSFNRIASNCVMKMETAYIFAIEIHKDANNERYAFNQIGHNELRGMTFDRIKEYDDITSIEFELENEYDDIEHYEYYINWTGDSDYNNDSQVSHIGGNGNLYIVIAKDKNVEDFFYFEIINDNEVIDVDEV